MIEGIIIAAVSAVSGLVVAFWQRRGQQEITVSHRYESLVDDLEGLRQQLRKENAELRGELRALQMEYEALRRDLARLEGVEARHLAAVEHIKVLRLLVAVERRPPVPEILRDDVA